MGHKTHDDVAARWVQRALHGQQSAPAHKSNNLHDEGRSIYSYGHHFEVGRILIDEKTKQPRGWLLNGDRWGNTTNRHQAAVRAAVGGTGLPIVILPHEVLNAAGIELDTVSVVDVQSDWQTEREIRKYEPVGKVERETRYENGGWQNSLTGEFIEREGWQYNKPVTTCDHPEGESTRPVKYSGPEWEEYLEAEARREAHIRLHHGVWDEVRGRSINTGRVRRMHSRSIEWEIEDDPESPIGVAYTRTVRRHWLGASLIRAAVTVPITKRCTFCDGTGIGEERWHYDGATGEGPLTREQHNVWVDRDNYLMERNGGVRQDPRPRTVETYKRYDDCRACSRRGTVASTRRRWAHFLSGFDENETRPSYFFCELPTQASTTVAEALQELKPEAVVFAEELGREVKRQGDIFAIPLPGVTLADLKRDGGRHVRMVSEMIDEQVWGRRGTRRNVRRRESDHVAHILDTNHEASEVVYFDDGRTYARGMLVHSPSGRAPDHRRVSLGKTWHLVLKNTVPIGA